jgi:hypothetical protein
VVELAVAAAGALDRPAIVLQNLQQLANLHSILRPYHGRQSPLPELETTPLDKRPRQSLYPKTLLKNLLDVFIRRRRLVGFEDPGLAPPLRPQFDSQDS